MTFVLYIKSVDIPMRVCSLYLDDELIVDGGELTVPDMRPAARR